MISAHRNPIVSRRSALAGLGASAAVAATARHAAAQDATPSDMAGHPLVGAWIVDITPEDPANAPTVVLFTADGFFIDPKFGFSGVWEPTGPASGAFTFIGIIEDAGFNGYIANRGEIEVDETGNGWANVGSPGVAGMTVAADGTVLETSPEFAVTATRMQLMAESDVGTALPEVFTWEPAPPAEATPES
jgi:hypothetical protein